MARQEKGSRMRMLPPRVQLQQSDALTGSYPTNVRFSIDGRTGDYPINYDDTYTVNFVSSLNYIPAVGFPTGDIWLANSQSNDLSASIITTGSVRSQVIEGLPFFHFTPGQDLTPFRDNNQPAVDGKSTNNPFYATGSAENLVGEGFNSPLWSKNKIEIDMEVITPVSYGFYNKADGRPTYQMIYYNFDQKKWEGIGTGPNIGNILESSTFQENFLTSGAYGFGPSMVSYVNVDRVYNAGRPISSFGFPNAEKYNATASQLLNMSQYINEPFLVEKFVFEFSASLVVRSENPSTPGNPGTQRSSITTFFILNQPGYRYPNNLSETVITSSSTPSTGSINFDGNNLYKELVTYGQISALLDADLSIPTWAAQKEILKKEYNIENVLNFPLLEDGVVSWDSKIILSGTIKSQIPNENMGIIYNTDIPAPGSSQRYYTSYGTRYSRRNMRDISSGRDFANTLESPNIASYLKDGGLSLQDVTYQSTTNSSKYNPYVLLPTDKLIFGIQTPMPYLYYYYLNATSKIEIVIPIQTSKLTLYGSYIREDREYNDGINQLLSSDSIHEVIE